MPNPRPSRLCRPPRLNEAFDEQVGWIADLYPAIDQGPIVAMIENYRSRLLRKCFMRDPDTRRMTKKLKLKPQR